MLFYFTNGDDSDEDELSGSDGLGDGSLHDDFLHIHASDYEASMFSDEDDDGIAPSVHDHNYTDDIQHDSDQCDDNDPPASVIDSLANVDIDDTAQLSSTGPGSSTQTMSRSPSVEHQPSTDTSTLTHCA